MIVIAYVITTFILLTYKHTQAKHIFTTFHLVVVGSNIIKQNTILIFVVIQRDDH